MTNKQRTGNRPGQGRQPAIVPAGERAESLHVRVSPSQRAKVARNGGGQWVRGLIDAAQEAQQDSPQPHPEGITPAAPGESPGGESPRSEAYRRR